MKEVRTQTLLRHIPELTGSLLGHWVKSGYLVPMKGEGYNGYRVYPWEQYVKARYMAYLVYTLGFAPKSASDIADLALKRETVRRGFIWVSYGGSMFGIQDLEGTI